MIKNRFEKQENFIDKKLKKGLLSSIQVVYGENEPKKSRVIILAIEF